MKVKLQQSEVLVRVASVYEREGDKKHGERWMSFIARKILVDMNTSTVQVCKEKIECTRNSKGVDVVVWFMDTLCGIIYF